MKNEIAFLHAISRYSNTLSPQKILLPQEDVYGSRLPRSFQEISEPEARPI
jgi:hypothetical protein